MNNRPLVKGENDTHTEPFEKKIFIYQADNDIHVVNVVMMTINILFICLWNKHIYKSMDENDDGYLKKSTQSSSNHMIN